MDITLTENDKYSVLEIVDKKLTTEISPDFKTELVQLAKKNKSVICDLKNVEYVDSSGLSSLLIANRLQKENNQLFVLCNPSKQVSSLIKMTKLDNVLLVIDSIAEAIDYIYMNELEKNL